MTQAVPVSGTAWVPVRSRQETFAMQPQGTAYGRTLPMGYQRQAIQSEYQSKSIAKI
jgi:hypothetical protein